MSDCIHSGVQFVSKMNYFKLTDCTLVPVAESYRRPCLLSEENPTLQKNDELSDERVVYCPNCGRRDGSW